MSFCLQNTKLWVLIFMIFRYCTCLQSMKARQWQYTVIFIQHFQYSPFLHLPFSHSTQRHFFESNNKTVQMGVDNIESHNLHLIFSLSAGIWCLGRSCPSEFTVTSIVQDSSNVKVKNLLWIQIKFCQNRP